MVDLHCHILAAVDDGAVDLADTAEMARTALATGCRAVCATSHLWEGLFATSPELLEAEFVRAVRHLRAEGIELELIPGAENYLSERTPPHEFAEKAVPLGAAGRYVLLDFALDEPPPHVREAVEALAACGRTAVIAHPERNRGLQADIGPVAEWIEAGALIQVNAGSLIGLHGGLGARDTARRLLECGAAHVLASDAHDPGRRRPFCLDQGRVEAAGIVGPEEAERMARERPWRIVRGDDVEVEPPRLEPRRSGRGIWRRLWDG
jgi:protein-tyrosine phosphatase